MKFLFNERKPSGRFHYFSQAMEIEGILSSKDDTYCHLWATGGISQKKKGWHVTGVKPDRELCQMCENNWLKQYRYEPDYEI